MTGKCEKAMWTGGCPDGLCGKTAYGHKLHPKLLSMNDDSVNIGWACNGHGGPSEDDVKKHYHDCGTCGEPVDLRVLFEVLKHEHNESHYTIAFERKYSDEEKHHTR